MSELIKWLVNANETTKPFWFLSKMEEDFILKMSFLKCVPSPHLIAPLSLCFVQMVGMCDFK